MLRALWRRSRAHPVVGDALRAVDRIWWAHTIRRSGIVDVDFVRAQYPARRIGLRRAVRAYVRGGFRYGMAVNPLFLEQYVSAQLPDAGRVPALYAYLVADASRIDTTPAWNAAEYAATHAAAATANGGPVGHAWRSALGGARLRMRSGRSLDAVDLRRSAGAVDIVPPRPAVPGDAALLSDDRREPCLIVLRLGPDDADGRSLAQLCSLLAEPEADTLRVLLHAPEKSSGDLLVAARLLALSDPRVGLASSVPGEPATGEILIVREPETDVDADALSALRVAARHGPVAPLVLAADGTIASAGYVVHDEAAFAFLKGLPAEDARMFGETCPSAILHAPVLARRVGDDTAPRVLLHATAITRAPNPEAVSAPDHPDTPVPPLGRGLAVDRWSVNGPVLGRTRSTFALHDGTTVPRLRWAIKTAAPAGPRGENWGETHFARALAAALERLGQFAAVDAHPATHRISSALDDVSLVLRGPRRIDPTASGLQLLWIISHPDEITLEEIAGFDRVFAASRSWAASATERFTRTVEPLLQCTDAIRFHPTGAERDRDIVFVGNARGLHRPAVIAPIAAGLPLRVYGPDWRGYIPASHIAATGIENDALPLRYETAGAVLNDHWPAMQRHGFISNRPYDVLAAGGRVISDEVEGISAEFDGVVPTFRTGAELVDLLSNDLDTLFPSADELARVSALVRHRDSFDARARLLLDLAVAAR